jgi:hypothetical protein
MNTLFLKRLLLLFAMKLSFFNAFGQQEFAFRDSIFVKILPAYDNVGKFHRKIFGENYRKEYALDTKFPVIHLSEIAGGLKPTQKGGGNQSRSIRLEDAQGNEWVMRSVEKYPEVLLPPALRQTVARDILKDNMSAQHPYSALIVPVLAKAVCVPFSSPIIGWVAPDKNLGDYAVDFQNTVCLLEPREPIGKTDNTAKMQKQLHENNANSVSVELYLKLKCLDVLLGDWDRHDDQWRWHPSKSGNGINYIPVPRDRDQVFFRSEGKIQRYSQSSWYLPMMQGYERDIKNINWFLWEGREINSRIFNEIDEPRWNSIVQEFCSVMTDQLFEQALKKLPEPGYSLRKNLLLEQMKSRRAALPALMKKYYRFFNRIVDVELSNKNEFAEVIGTKNKGLLIKVFAARQDGSEKMMIYSRLFDPSITKEIRLYLNNGSDSVSLNNRTSDIGLRIIGGIGEKKIRVDASRANINVNAAVLPGIAGKDASKLLVKISADSSNLAYVPKDLYSRHIFQPVAEFNSDDGIAIGGSLKFINPGFRKMPYGNSQAFSFVYSFATDALKFRYNGEWLKAVGKADLLVAANVMAPSNTQNFFGYGNETIFDEGQNNVSYFRTRFDLIELSATLRFSKKKSMWGFGPSLQFYRYKSNQNQGRFIEKFAQLGTFGTEEVLKDKAFAGVTANYTADTRNNTILARKGYYLEVKVTGYKGLNENSNSYARTDGSFSFYSKLDSKGNLIIADRIGGGITVGHPAFFQSPSLGGQGNLLGYRQFRFAGRHSLYNNFELRIKLGDFVNYLLPGQIGVLALYDIGRVWVPGEYSNAWHSGSGGGIYFAPASLAVLRLVGAYSKEGWYPLVSLSFRY